MNFFRSFVFSLVLSLAYACTSGHGTDFRVISPDGTLAVDVRTGDSLTYAVTRHGASVLLPSAIALQFDDGTAPGRVARVSDVHRSAVEREIEAPFHRQARFTEHYNQLRLDFEGGYSVTFRVFDEGCAYRFETALTGGRTVADEVAEFNFAGDPELFVAYSDGLCNAYQSQYVKCRLSELGTEKPVLLPLAADCGPAGRVLVCESDLESYPGMFLMPSSGGLRGLFAQVPDSCYLHERRCQEKVATRHGYIACVQGARTYPWRILAVADEDRELPTNNLVYALAAENRIGDSSWVKPGKVAWEWWNDWGLTGVGFKPGIDTRTYKAYIDFAADYGLEYVVLDEGWSDPKAGDVMSVVAEIDLPELVRYAASKGVGLMLWAVGNVLDAKLEEACAYYAGLGVRGFKIDFIDRDDQKAVELVYRISEAAAAHKLMLDIHGIYKPTGLNRTFPNIVNFESVFGLEELKWSNPDMPLYDVTFPFIRMVQGPVDYTPGAYRNATRDGFKIDYRNPMSQGTRAHQVATYVVFDAPLVMLCDSPTRYMADDACTRFIASLPVVFDTTQVLAGRIGEYIVTARRAGEKWYVGGLTDWTPRTLEADLSFLVPGREYTATLLCDDERSDIEPERHTIASQKVTSATRLQIPVAPGGGFALKIEPVETDE